MATTEAVTRTHLGKGIISMSAAAAIGNLVSGIMLYTILCEDQLVEPIRQWLSRNDLALPAVAAASGISALLTLTAYYLTLDWRFLRRPYTALWVQWSTAAAAAILAGVAAFRFPLQEWPVIAGTIVGSLIAPFLLMPLESILGKPFLAMAARQAEAGRPGAVGPAKLGLRFCSGNPSGRRSLGLGFLSAGQNELALPLLEETYDRGDKSSRLLNAYGTSLEHAGDLTQALTILDELAATHHAMDRFEDRVRLNRQLERPQAALDLINALPDSHKETWRAVRNELLWEVRDTAALREEAKRYESEEGPPFRSARKVLHGIQELEPDALDILQDLARLAELAGDQNELVPLLEAMVMRLPDSAGTWRKLRRELIRADRHADALHALCKLADLGAATVDERIDLAEEHAKRGDYATMDSLLEQHDGEALRTPRGTLMRVRARFEEGRHEDAIAAAEQGRAAGLVVGVAGEDIAAIEGRIRAQALSAELLALTEEAKHDPTNMALQLRLMGRLVETGATDRVVVLADSLLEDDLDGTRLTAIEHEIMRLATTVQSTPTARLLGYAGDLRLRANDYDQALERYAEAADASIHSDAILLEGTRKILQVCPNHIPSNLAAADLMMRGGDARAALRHLDVAKDAGADWADEDELLRVEFDAACRVGQHERAIRVGNQLHARQPADKTVLLALTDQLSGSGRFDEALHLLNTAHAADKADMAIRSRMRQTMERRKKARVEGLKTELAASPNSPELHEELGDLLLADNRFNEAIVEFQKAALNNPNGRRARAKLGFTLSRKGMHAEAEEAFNETDLPTNLQADVLDDLKTLFFESALLMERDREHDRALNLFKRVAKIDMGYQDVLGRIERLTRSIKRRVNV